MGGTSGSLQGLLGVVGPALPRRKTILLLVAGVVIGLLWAYLISPTIYYDADPSTLQQNFQDEWVKLLADRQDATNADLTQHIADLLAYVDDPQGIVDRLLNNPAEIENQAKLQSIRSAAVLAQPNDATAPEPNAVADVLPFIVGPLVVVVVFVVLSALWNLLLWPLLQPSLSRAGIGRSTGGTVSDEQSAREIAVIRESRRAMAENKTSFSADVGQPLMQKMSIYTLGRGQYDDSFSIEDENDRFLGECGAGISETIGVGDPKKVTALEVWLFDKDDFVRTVTKIFASAHAFNDPALRARLEAKGDLVLVEPGAVVTLETASLRLQARVVEVQYGTGPLPPNSYFEKLTLELAAWRKAPGAAPQRVEPQGVAVPAGVPLVSQSASGFNTNNPTIPTPAINLPPAPQPSVVPASPFAPPSMPQPQVQPRPAPTFSPPPMAPPPLRRTTDDDPFGGTGDFTPVT